MITITMASSVWWSLAGPAPAVLSPSPPAVKVPNGTVVFVSARRGVPLSLRSGGLRGDRTVCLAAVRGDGEEEEAPEQKRRHPLDFPYEYVRPKPAARTNVFPKLPPMTTPLPTWLPYDQEPDDEIDEDELENEEEQEQYEENPEQFE